MLDQTYVLRAPIVADVDSVIAIHCDPRTNEFRPGGSPTASNAAGYLPPWIEHWNSHGFGYWSVVERESDKVVGFGGVMKKQIGPRVGFNLYFRLSPEVWGKGLALIIGRSALKEAFERQGADSVIGKVGPANIPSRKTLERLGMGLTGELHDGPKQEPSFIYTITRQGYSSAA